ncbi:MAG: DUF4388 domain-containing protein [Candidatus Aminicenantes bacterium]|nr:DUF4388 domain-containing protein [Candidatus Aminicenantes bacterium]
MNDVPLAGALKGLSLPRLLFSLSEAGRSGRLALPGPGNAVVLFLDRDRLLLDAPSLPEPVLKKGLREAGLFDAAQLEACEARSGQDGTGLLQAALETDGTDPEAVWGVLEAEYKARLFALFDAPLAAYEFEPGRLPAEAEVLSSLPLRPLLLEGLRRMTSDALISASLPPASEPLQALAPADDDRLASHERYLLRALGQGRNLEELRRLSRLGPRRTDRAMHLLLLLGLAGRPAPKDPARQGRELSPSEIDRMMAAFRDKSNAIFRYISKELGPFARTVLGKALEEVKPTLGPLFESIALLEDGTIEFRSPLKINVNLLTEESQAELARGLTEILSAEVLAVKKSLGNDHEAVLVRNLEKVGEWS